MMIIGSRVDYLVPRCQLMRLEAMPAVHSILRDDVMMVDSSDSEDSDVELLETVSPRNGHPDDRFFHFMEVYSPFRVAAAIHKMGMNSAGSLDLLSGCDLLTTDGRLTALALLDHRRPMFLMASPPCTMYSELTRLWNAKKMQWEDREIRQRDADLMLKFAMELCRLQGQAGRLWCHEHPHRASSWKLDVATLFHYNKFCEMAFQS